MHHFPPDAGVGGAGTYTDPEARADLVALLDEWDGFLWEPGKFLPYALPASHPLLKPFLGGNDGREWRLPLSAEAIAHTLDVTSRISASDVSEEVRGFARAVQRVAQEQAERRYVGGIGPVLAGATLIAGLFVTPPGMNATAVGTVGPFLLGIFSIGAYMYASRVETWRANLRGLRGESSTFSGLQGFVPALFCAAIPFAFLIVAGINYSSNFLSTSERRPDGW